MCPDLCIPATSCPWSSGRFRLLTENLREGDRISIVTYASGDAVVLEGAKGSDQFQIMSAIEKLNAEGSTYGSKGIETAYRIAQENFIEGGNNRVILATDGDLNVGLTTVDELTQLISEKRESGIFLSVLGFGSGNQKDVRYWINWATHMGRTPTSRSFVCW